MKEIEISFILPIHNDAKVLHWSLMSIVRQLDRYSCELIVVDDASTDESREVARGWMKEAKNCVLIENEEAKGAATRLNQGAMAARGKYLFCMEGDSILCVNALYFMMYSLRKYDADFVVGKLTKSQSPAMKLMTRVVEHNCAVRISDAPLNDTIGNQCARMAYLVKKSVFQCAGGADESLLLYDGALAIRLAHCSKRCLFMTKAPIVIPKSVYDLKRNSIMQFYNKFYAHYNALKEFKNLTIVQKRLLYRRALAATWNMVRISGNPIQKSIYFTLYALNRIVGLSLVNLELCRRRINIIYSKQKVK